MASAGESIPSANEVPPVGNYPYVKQSGAGIDMGDGVSMPLPFPILLLVSVLFVAVIGFIIYKILNMEKVRQRQKDEKKRVKEEKRKHR